MTPLLHIHRPRSHVHVHDARGVTVVLRDAALLSHAEVGFEHPARGPHCCRQCIHFLSPGCTIVQPPVTAPDWCRRFDLRGAVGDKSDWSEQKHPRGQPENAGEFAPKGGGSTGKHKSSGGGHSLSQTDERAWTGRATPTKTPVGKAELGALGERLAVQFLKDAGFSDADALHDTSSGNFPLDLVGDHEIFEVKTGVSSSGTPRWRVTIGQPGKAETEWLKTAPPEEKRAWNRAKVEAAIERKHAVVQQFSQKLGRPIHPKTIAIIVNPDTKTADFHVLDGFHSDVGWNSSKAIGAYVGSFKYE